MEEKALHGLFGREFSGARDPHRIAKDSALVLRHHEFGISASRDMPISSSSITGDITSMMPRILHEHSADDGHR